MALKEVLEVTSNRVPFFLLNLHLDVFSNFSDFFLRFHFQGLNKRPKADNRLRCLFTAPGGPRPDPRSKLLDR